MRNRTLEDDSHNLEFVSIKLINSESEKCGFEGSLDARRHLIHGEVATYHACNRSSTKHSLMQHSRENNNVIKV